MYYYFFALLISMYSLHSLAFLKSKKETSPSISTSLLPCDSKAHGTPHEPCIRAVIEITHTTDYVKGEAHNTVALDLSCNKLETCIDLRRYPNLRELNLSTNLLITLPSSTCACKQLTRLNLAHNHIKTIPRAIRELINLIILDMSYNLIEAVPDEVCSLKKLTTLDVSYNAQLKSIPTTLSALAQLISCNVARTKLSERSINQLIETFGRESVHF